MQPPSVASRNWTKVIRCRTSLAGRTDNDLLGIVKRLPTPPQLDLMSALQPRSDALHDRGALCLTAAVVRRRRWVRRRSLAGQPAQAPGVEQLGRGGKAAELCRLVNLWLTFLTLSSQQKTRRKRYQTSNLVV